MCGLWVNEMLRAAWRLRGGERVWLLWAPCGWRVL